MQTTSHIHHRTERIRDWLRTKPVGQAFQPANEPSNSVKLASIVEESLFFGYDIRYILHAYVIMSDHVHILLTPLPEWTLARIHKGLKGFTAREINKVLARKGAFWFDENFDHLIRNEADWLDKFDYIHRNSVEAGLVDRVEDYPFSSLVTIHSHGRLKSLPHTTPDLKITCRNSTTAR